MNKMAPVTVEFNLLDIAQKQEPEGSMGAIIWFTKRSQSQSQQPMACSRDKRKNEIRSP